LPIFEYKCPSGHLSEVIDVSNKSRLPNIVCPWCGDRADKVLSRVHVQSGLRLSESTVSRAIARVQARKL
jgi:predicted nucleic acid-binding Zn ribbon protein